MFCPKLPTDGWQLRLGVCLAMARLGLSNGALWFEWRRCVGMCTVRVRAWCGWSHVWSCDQDTWQGHVTRAVSFCSPPSNAGSTDQKWDSRKEMDLQILTDLCVTPSPPPLTSPLTLLLPSLSSPHFSSSPSLPSIPISSLTKCHDLLMIRKINRIVQTVVMESNKAIHSQYEI